jgi:hypothetical protein
MEIGGKNKSGSVELKALTAKAKAADMSKGEARFLFMRRKT